MSSRLPATCGVAGPTHLPKSSYMIVSHVHVDLHEHTHTAHACKLQATKQDMSCSCTWGLREVGVGPLRPGGSAAD